MNIFRLLGDFLHVLSFVFLLDKIQRRKSCAGISLKTQELYVLVFVTRYLDLFWNFSSMYNYILKLAFLGTSVYIVWEMRTRLAHTYDNQHDTFQTLYIIVPCAFLGLVWNEMFTFSEVLWSFSIFLEALTILPQILLLYRSREVENMTSHYVFCLGFYILNWIYRYFTDIDGYHPELSVILAGIVQTLLYADFFYYYLDRYGDDGDLIIYSKLKGTKLTLPK